jgi:hypothetical protein
LTTSIPAPPYSPVKRTSTESTSTSASIVECMSPTSDTFSLLSHSQPLTDAASVDSASRQSSADTDFVLVSEAPVFDVYPRSPLDDESNESADAADAGETDDAMSSRTDASVDAVKAAQDALANLEAEEQAYLAELAEFKSTDHRVRPITYQPDLVFPTSHMPRLISGLVLSLRLFLRSSFP